MKATTTRTSQNGRVPGFPPARPPDSSLTRSAGAIARATVGCVLVIALMCHLLFAESMRQSLGFLFDPPPATIETAIETLRANAGLATLALLAALLVSQLGPAPSAGRSRAANRAARGVCAVMLSATWALNVWVVGLSLGAYGPRMLRALLPHGPVELVAFSLALGAYFVAQRHPLAPARLFGVWLVVLALLALAAALETWGAG